MTTQILDVVNLEDNMRKELSSHNIELSRELNDGEESMVISILLELIYNKSFLKINGEIINNAIDEYVLNHRGSHMVDQNKVYAYLVKCADILFKSNYRPLRYPED